MKLSSEAMEKTLFFFFNVNFLEMISEVLNNIYSPINMGSAFTDTDFLI